MPDWTRGALGAAFVFAIAALVTPADAQTKLKWAHVYETTEPYHTTSVWAAEEINKRTNGATRLTSIRPRSSARNPTQSGPVARHRRHDYFRSSFAARSYAPIGVTYYPYTFTGADHLLAYTKSDVFKELAKGYEEKTTHHIVAVTYYGVRHTTSNRAFKNCEEMKGLKIGCRTRPLTSQCRAPAAPTPRRSHSPKFILRCRTERWDAQENPLTTIEAKKFFEVQKYIILTGTSSIT